jgi:hypothetical protein
MGALRNLQNWEANGWIPKLDKWWNQEGRSATWIAKLLGVSRGAVLGKAHRLGWSGNLAGGKGGKNGFVQRSKPKPSSRHKFKRMLLLKARPRNAADQERLHHFWGTPPALGSCATKIVELPSDPPASERKSFIENDGCCWPFADNTFCGRAKKGIEHSYCCDHHKRAHLPDGRKAPTTKSW